MQYDDDDDDDDDDNDNVRLSFHSYNYIELGLYPHVSVVYTFR